MVIIQAFLKLYILKKWKCPSAACMVLVKTNSTRDVTLVSEAKERLREAADGTERWFITARRKKVPAI